MILQYSNEYFVIMVTGLIFFANAIHCGYCVDDLEIIKRIKESDPKKMSVSEKLRLYLYGAGLFKSVQADHLFNILLHITNSCLIYKASGSFLASSLYLINPVNNQTALWLNGRRYAIGILCALLAWNFHWLFIPAYAFATFLHVYAIALPLMMLFTPAWPMVPIAMGAMSIFGFKQIKNTFNSRKEQFSNGNELQKLNWKKSIIYVKSFGFYFFHTIFPNKPKMYHDFLYYFGRTKEANEEGYRINFDFLKGAVALSFVGYELIFQNNLWAIWFVVFISQYCNIVTVTMNAADRYCSLAGIGLMVIAAKYLGFLPSPYKEIAITALVTFYVLRYLPLFRAYKTITSFFEYHFSLQPDLVKPRINYAVRCLMANDPYQAFVVIKQGLKLRPNDFELLITMAQIFLVMGKYEPMLKILDKAEKYYPLGEEEECAEQIEMMREAISQVNPMASRLSHQANDWRNCNGVKKAMLAKG